MIHLAGYTDFFFSPLYYFAFFRWWCIKWGRARQGVTMESSTFVWGIVNLWNKNIKL